MPDIGEYGADARRDLKLVTTLARCLQAINRREAPLIREAGLSFSQFGVLEMLYHKGPQRIKDIIAKTLATGGNLTVVVGNLEKQKYIRRRPHPDDGRACLLELSPKGRGLIAGLFRRHIKNLQRIMKGLSNAEKDNLSGLCKKLGKSIV